MELKVRLLSAQGEQDQAMKVLDGWVGTKKEKDPTVFAAAAGLSEQLGDVVAAERYYRLYATKAKGAEGTLMLARFLGRQKNGLAEAIECCRRAWRNSPVDEVAATLMTVLRTSRPRDEDFQLEEGELQVAKERESRPILELSLAAIHEMRGKYDEAEKIYRQVLARDVNNPIALNNLAWVLALQNRNNEYALELITSAYGQLGPIAELLDTRGVIYFNLRDSKLAIRDLEDVTQRPEVQPGLKATCEFHLARAYHQVGYDESARAALKRSRIAGLDREKLPAPERLAYDKLSGELGVTP